MIGNSLHSNPPIPRLAITLLGVAALCQAAVQAQVMGVASLGATGGLTIASAYVLGTGDAALSVANYQPAKLGTFSRRQNYSLGFGLLPGVEVFGRFADYQNQRTSLPGLPDINGPRDLSANFKWQLPIDMYGLPKLAVGATDVSGGAAYFSSKYAVASDEYGPLRWSLGYAKGKAALGSTGGAKVLDGVFGGAELKLGGTGAAVLAETDGTQRHAGLRYYLDPLPWLAYGQVVGTVQRSFGATNMAGRGADATSFNVSLVLPLGVPESERKARGDAALKPLPPIVSAEGGAMLATADDRMDALARALRAIGLDRVRVGALGNEWVVEYENYRYLQNETDAMGIVLGLAAEHAPARVIRVNALTLKAGQVMFQTSVDVAPFRNFLRDGDAASVKDTLIFGGLAADDIAAVQWAGGKAQQRTRLRVEVKPLVNYTLGTEFGAFDYSLAANVRGTASLWPGAEIYSDLVQRLSHSENMESNRVFGSSLHRNGLKTLALQQSFWLKPWLFASVGVGKYNYRSLGAEGESILFLPWNEDTMHLKGSYQRQKDDAQPRRDEAYAASYRWNFDPQTWVEGGYNQYTDRSTGPSLALTRWFGDVALQVFARKGGANTFVGMELSLPLTPRQGMGAGAVQLTGTPRYAQAIRTLMTNGGNSGNFIRPNAVRPVDLNYKPEVELLNSGRITPAYIKNQVQRMRESFFLYARDQLS